MDQAICPYCNKTILLKDLISKPLAGKNSPSKSFLERLSSKDMLAVTSVYICPNCNKILSISR